MNRPPAAPGRLRSFGRALALAVALGLGLSIAAGFVALVRPVIAPAPTDVSTVPTVQSVSRIEVRAAPGSFSAASGCLTRGFAAFAAPVIAAAPGQAAVTVRVVAQLPCAAVAAATTNGTSGASAGARASH